MTQYVGWLRGCGTALVTPFTGTGAVDEKRFRALVERQIAAGVRVLVPRGTTGEAPTPTATEPARRIALTAETAPGPAQVPPGAGGNATAASLAPARPARAPRADAPRPVA